MIHVLKADVNEDLLKLKTDLKIEINDEKMELKKINQEHLFTHFFGLSTKRCSGDAYVNFHSKAFSKKLAFNNNVAIGDSQKIYYSTNYSTKNTQEQDRF